MSTRVTRKEFETIYQKTYSQTLRFIIVKCKTIDNVRYYHKKKKDNIVSYYSENKQENELDLKDDFDLEQNMITKENVKEVWKYLKTKI